MKTSMAMHFGLVVSAALTVGVALSLIACTATSATPARVPTTPTAAPLPVAARTAAPSGITEQALKNAEYKLPDIGTFRLRDGQFEYSYGSGGAQVNKVGFLQAADGDLNGDGHPDAAVSLWATTGGSGTYVYLVAMIDQGGNPTQAAADLIGDRVQVQRLTVQDGKIVVVAKAFAKGDPMCCPSLQVTRTYQLDATTLKVVSETK